MKKRKFATNSLLFWEERQRYGKRAKWKLDHQVCPFVSSAHLCWRLRVSKLCWGSVGPLWPAVGWRMSPLKGGIFRDVDINFDRHRRVPAITEGLPWVLPPFLSLLLPHLLPCFSSLPSIHSSFHLFLFPLILDFPLLPSPSALSQHFEAFCHGRPSVRQVLGAS